MVAIAVVSQPQTQVASSLVSSDEEAEISVAMCCNGHRAGGAEETENPCASCYMVAT